MQLAPPRDCLEQLQATASTRSSSQIDSSEEITSADLVQTRLVSLFWRRVAGI